MAALPGAANAQQIGDINQGDVLQPGGNALQQSPGGLQGSTPAVFGGTSGGFLDKGPQKLKVANTSIPASSKTAKPVAPGVESDGGGFPAVVWILLFAGAGLVFWWRRSART